MPKYIAALKQGGDWDDYDGGLLTLERIGDLGAHNASPTEKGLEIVAAMEAREASGEPE